MQIKLKLSLMWMDHMNKLFCTFLCSIFLSGCVLVPTSVTTTLMGGVLVAAAGATILDDIECGDIEPNVFIVSPEDGFISDSKNINVVFGSENIEIVPAGVQKRPENKCHAVGHHHLLINVDENPKVWIPFDANHLHYGAGQTEATIELEPGKYTLQLMLGSSVHNTKQSINNFAGQGPFVSEKIAIEVISSE